MKHLDTRVGGPFHAQTLPLALAKTPILGVMLVLCAFLGGFSPTLQAQNCAAPSGVSIVSVLSDKINFNLGDAANGPIRVGWAESPGNTFVYREFSTASAALEGLKSNTNYLVRVDRRCASGAYSPALNFGYLRTLSKDEEQQLCTPGLEGELCQLVQQSFSGERGDTYFEIVVPRLPPSILSQYDKHNLTVQYRPKGQNAPWQSKLFSYANLNQGSIMLEGLSPNTLYEVKLQWQATGPGAPMQTCSNDMADTPTEGPNHIGPYFIQKPLHVTRGCSGISQVPRPTVGGGCSTPRLTFSDAPPTGDVCSRTVVRTWTAVDNCGRSCSATQLIVTVDRQPPRFVDVPSPSGLLECGENLPTDAPTAVDDCGTATVAYSVAELPNGAGCAKTVTRTWVATDACGNTAAYTQTITVRQPTENPNGEDPRVPDLPVACGQTYTPPSANNTAPLASALAGQSINIAGFPILLESVNGGGGTFSGQGKIRLPFTKKVALVQFSNVRVNTDRSITSGEVSAIADPNFQMPSGGQLDLGGEICLPEPALSASGFNNDGIYVRQPPYEGWAEGDPIDPNLDPNGFDANGYHRATGEQYNEEGCNQQGLDRNGDPCNPASHPPYHWLRDSTNLNQEKPPITNEGTALATALQPSLRDKILAAINTKQGQNTALLDTKRAECGTKRSELETTATGLDKKYLFGPNDEYLKEGMSSQFKSTPVPLQVNVPDRAQQIKDVETQHIALYYCDKLIQKYKQIDAILTQFKSPYDLDALVNAALDALKRLPAAQANELKDDPAKQAAWLATFVADALEKELKKRGLAFGGERGGPNYMAPPDDAQQRWGNADAPQHPWRFLAADASQGSQAALAQLLGAPSEDELEFAFRQGFEYIGDTHRAFYLEAIANARDKDRGMGGNGQDPENLMPIRIEKTAGGRTYTILLDKIGFTPNGGTLNAYCIVAIPNSEQKLVFRALNVPFTPGGMGPNGIQLQLVSDIGIRLNNTAKLNIVGNSGNTFVRWDCNGFAGMGVEAEIEFCRNYFVPLTPALEVDTNSAKRVKARFTAQMPAWGEFIATLNVDPFALAKHPDYKWQIQNASIDFSDSQNPPNFTGITPNYSSEFSESGGGFKTQWKGFFLEALTVTFPTKFQKNGAPPARISANKLIIDDRGVTGLLSAEANFVPLQDGNLGGWAFSVDRFRLAVVTNRIQGGGFGGLVHVPIFGNPDAQGTPSPSDCFRYSASIIATDAAEYYEFTVKPAAGSLPVGIWVGQATLDSTSSLRVAYENGQFDIAANLTGQVVIDGNLGTNTKFEIPAFRFQNIALSNRAPYFRGGSFGLPDTLGAKIGGFSLTVQLPKLHTTATGGTSTMEVGALLRLVGGDTEDDSRKLNIAAATRVLLHGEMVVTDGRQRWKYKDYDVTEIALAASWKGVNRVTGRLTWYKNHPDFGRGFRGEVTAQFSGLGKLGSLGVAAIAQFGSMQTYKYFMVDALALLKPGIPLGGIDLRGFGGGAFYHMDRDSSGFLGLGGQSGIGGPLGTSLSGIRYVPNNNIGLGLKALVVIAAGGNDELFNAAVTFEIRFNSPENGGGIKDIALYGKAKMFSELKFSDFTGRPTPNVPIAATASIVFDFQSDTYHGDLEVFINVAGVFVGSGGGSFAGNAAIHFGPSEWYIHLGTPSRRWGIAVNVPIGDQELSLLTFNSYICVGSGMPAMPDLPPFVREMTGSENFMVSEGSRASGKGYAYGASLQLSTPRIPFLIFYAQINAGIGFDVMLQKYEGLNCANTGGAPIGINGWYASGQAWAYLDADVGLKFRGLQYSILRVSAAAALQVKLPNPFWAKGAFGGRYRILGGLVKGQCNFKFVLGKNCESTNNTETEAQYVKLIEALEPGDKNERVETSAKPVAYFGVPVNGSFSVNDDDGNETVYYANLVEAKLTKVGDGTRVNGILQASADKREASLFTPAFLEGNTRYRFEAKVECLKNGAVVRTETKTVEFTTGDAPTVIPKSNVAASYPLDGMYNLYRSETDKGFFRLKNGQPDLLEGAQLVARFHRAGGGTVETPIKVSNNASVLEFPLPAQLEATRCYRMEVVSLPRETYSTGGGGQIPERVLHTLFFRVSAYGRFADKVAAFTAQSTATANGRTLVLGANMEPFDRIEMEGSAQAPPLVGIQPGSSAFYDWVKERYEALDAVGFVPTRRHVASKETAMPGKDAFSFALQGQTAALPTANGDLFDANAAAPQTANVVFSYTLFAKAHADFTEYAEEMQQKVLAECAICDKDDGNTPHTCEKVLYPAKTCCCSDTYIEFLNNTVLKDLYTYRGNEPTPTAGSQHPAYLSYTLPGLGSTTPGARINFVKP